MKRSTKFWIQMGLAALVNYDILWYQNVSKSISEGLAWGMFGIIFNGGLLMFLLFKYIPKFNDWLDR